MRPDGLPTKRYDMTAPCAGACSAGDMTAPDEMAPLWTTGFACAGASRPGEPGARRYRASGRSGSPLSVSLTSLAASSGLPSPAREPALAARARNSSWPIPSYSPQTAAASAVLPRTSSRRILSAMTVRLPGSRRRASS